MVFFKQVLADDFEFKRMQNMQLSSKMRFIAAQFNALLGNNLWKRSASHANSMAQILARGLSDIGGITLTQEVQANEVFAIIPPKVIPSMQEQWFFHVWNEKTSEVRLITSFDTTEEDVEQFAAALEQTLTRAQRLPSAMMRFNDSCARASPSSPAVSRASSAYPTI